MTESWSFEPKNKKGQIPTKLLQEKTCESNKQCKVTRTGATSERETHICHEANKLR